MCFAEHVCAVRLRGEGRREKGEERTQPGRGQERGCAGCLKREDAREMEREMMRGVGKEKATEWRSHAHSLILSLAKQATNS